LIYKIDSPTWSWAS